MTLVSARIFRSLAASFPLAIITLMSYNQQKSSSHGVVSAFAAGATPPSFLMKNGGSTIKAEWVDLAKENGPSPITPPRSGHVSWTSGEDVYVFGGYAEEIEDESEGSMSSPHRYVTNDLWKYTQNDGNSGWTNISSQQAGDIPQTRLASACAVVHNQDHDQAQSILLIGGWDPETAGTGGVILDTIHELNLATLKWTKLPIQTPDGPTSRHIALTMADGSVLVHNHRCTDHVFLLKRNEDSEWTIVKQATSGQAPSPRGLHAATTFDSSNRVMVFGGAAQSGDMSNEVFVLDCHTFKWTSIPCQALDAADGIAIPSPRASPCLVELPLDSGDTDDHRYPKFILFGGAERTEEGGLNGLNDTWLLHLDEKQSCGYWEKLCNKSPNSISPPGRNAATLDAVSSAAINSDPSTTSIPHEQYFLLQGGWAPFRQTYNDNYVLKVSVAGDADK